MSHALAHLHDSDVPALEIHRLDAYRVALEFYDVAAEATRSVHGELRSQLDRASLSIPLNIAEGFGRRSPGERRRFYSIARGSAFECAALIDVLTSRGIVTIGTLRQLRSLLVRIVRMLTRLGQR